ncbi:hypothetical protein D3C72_2052850 [compost metagenome]
MRMPATIGSPGSGPQHGANCTAWPSLPWIRMGALRAEVSSSTAAAVVATNWCSGANRRATTAARRLPKPISARISSRELAPVLRANFCQAGSSVAGIGMCNSCKAWLSKRSPNATDSSYLTVRR